MSEIGDFRFKKGFAWFPKRVLTSLPYDKSEHPFLMSSEYFSRIKPVWLRPYYSVSRYIYKTWIIPARIGWDEYDNVSSDMADWINANGRLMALWPSGGMLKDGKRALKKHHKEAIRKYKKACKRQFTE